VPLREQDFAGDIPLMTTREFEQISRLAHEHFGLDLPHAKQSLVSARLGKHLLDLGLNSFEAYFEHVVSDHSGAALTSMVDHLTTNHTSFFREPAHFDFLRKTVFPALRTRSRIDIWSAACSSGEEPYSIAMSLLEEAREDTQAKVRIKASDISTRVLEDGRRGIYACHRFRGLPESFLRKYLLKGSDATGDCYRFKQEVRSLIQFEHMNLMQPIPAGYRFSVIFCRNIMIYFDRATQQDLVHRLTAQLEPGGYLLIGHSESLNAISHGLEYISPATYRKAGSHTQIGSL
jgi:chemotaxis protein methyltransferase CheR